MSNIKNVLVYHEVDRVQKIREVMKKQIPTQMPFQQRRKDVLRIHPLLFAIGMLLLPFLSLT